MLGSSEDWGPPGSPEFPRSSKSGTHHPGTVPPPLARGTVAGDNWALGTSLGTGQEQEGHQLTGEAQDQPQ